MDADLNPARMPPQVGAGAQVLAFDATAAVVLSDGTTCNVEAPESHIRAKGFKHAVAGGGGGAFSRIIRSPFASTPMPQVVT